MSPGSPLSPSLASKTRLLAWAEDQALEFRTRYILEKLASFAGPTRETWAPVAYLSRVAQCSERKVQYCLAQLKAGGFLAATAKRKRLDDSTRSVPVYRVAPSWNAEMTAEIAAEDAPVSMGANGAPIDGADPAHGCTDDGVWVHRACTPKDLKDPTEFANAHGAGARDALVEGYQALEAATPRKVLGQTDPDEGLAAYRALAADGIDVAELAGCVRRWGESPGFGTRKFPPGLHVWLAKRQYREWWPEPVTAAGPGAAVSAPDPVEALPAEVVAAFGADFVRAWLGGAVWREADQTLVTVRVVQRNKIRGDRSGVLHDHGWRVIAQADLSSDPASEGAR